MYLLHPLLLFIRTGSEKDFHTQLDKALKEGFVEILTAKCGVSGPPWSGKTNFKALLSGKKRPSGERQSTAIATEAEQMTPAVDMRSNFDDKLLEMHRTLDGSHVRWFVTDNKKLALLVANTAKIPSPSLLMINGECLRQERKY